MSVPTITELTDAELDAVTGGLITVVAADVVDVNNNNIVRDVDVAVPANVGAAVAVLGTATNVAAQRSPVIQ
jgi:hypothetical protein